MSHSARRELEEKGARCVELHLLLGAMGAHVVLPHIHRTGLNAVVQRTSARVCCSGRSGGASLEVSGRAVSARRFRGRSARSRCVFSSPALGVRCIHAMQHKRQQRAFRYS